jgi:hypothetical protein
MENILHRFNEDMPLKTEKYIEPGLKYILTNNLKEYKKYKLQFNSQVINFLLFIFFVIILALILYYCYKHKRIKKISYSNNEIQKYIINMVDKIQREKNKNNMITDLPPFDEEIYLNNKKFI